MRDSRVCCVFISIQKNSDDYIYEGAVRGFSHCHVVFRASILRRLQEASYSSERATRDSPLNLTVDHCGSRWPSSIYALSSFGALKNTNSRVIFQTALWWFVGEKKKIIKCTWPDGGSALPCRLGIGYTPIVWVESQCSLSAFDLWVNSTLDEVPRYCELIVRLNWKMSIFVS